MRVYVGDMRVCINDCVSSSGVEGRELGIAIFNVESDLIEYSVLIAIGTFWESLREEISKENTIV